MKSARPFVLPLALAPNVSCIGAAPIAPAAAAAASPPPPPPPPPPAPPPAPSPPPPPSPAASLTAPTAPMVSASFAAAAGGTCTTYSSESCTKATLVPSGEKCGSTAPPGLPVDSLSKSLWNTKPAVVVVVCAGAGDAAACVSHVPTKMLPCDTTSTRFGPATPSSCAHW